jgi:adenosine deaminase
MSINTDARTVTPVTLSSEYNKLQDVFHWEKAHFLRCNLEGIRYFTNEEVKRNIAARIQEAYNNC